MKYQIVLLSLIVSLGGCGQRGASNGNIQEEKPGTAVTLTHAAFGKIEKETILYATTAYQNKLVVGAPIPAFITEVLVQPGSRVKAGDILYRIESKEQHALGSGNQTAIPIQAERDGIAAAGGKLCHRRRCALLRCRSRKPRIRDKCPLRAATVCP